MLLPLALWSQSALKTEADSLFKLGNYSKVIGLYQDVQLEKQDHETLALSYQAIGNYDLAMSHYDLALEAEQGNLNLKYQNAKLLASLKRYDRAKALYQELIAKDSLNPNFYFEMGKLLEQSKDSLAINFYNKTYNLDPTHQKAIFKIARHKLVKRKHSESLEYIDKGLSYYANNVELISLKAQNLYWLEDYEKAIFWFEKLIALGEKSEMIYEKLSISQAENFNYEKAIEYRKKCLQYDPTNADALHAVAIYYDYLQNFEKAEEYLLMSLALKDVPLSQEYQKLGVIYNRQKKYAQAIEAFQKALKEDPENMSADFFMAMSKDQYYEDIDARIKVFEDLGKKYKDSPFAQIASNRIKELKEEKFKEQD